MDFSKLKNRAGKGIESLQEKVEQLNGGGAAPKDEREWSLKLDSTASGSAVIRFLPARDDETPMTKEISYFFRGPGGVYSELSPATIGLPCPVRERNSEDWQAAEANGDEALKNKVKGRRQNVKFRANILVVEDSANPDNEGKVFIFKFGKQIKNIIDKTVKPEYADEKPIDPFDMWFGANFKFRSKGREMPDPKTGKKIVVPNYEDSKFADPSELFPGDDAKKEEIWKQTYSLVEFIDPKRFKDYDTLKAQMDKVLGGSGTSSAPARAADKKDDEPDLPMQNQERPAQSVNDTPKAASAPAAASFGIDDDDDLAFFQNLGK